MMQSNTAAEEAERRQSMLFSDILTAMNRFAGADGRHVELISTTEIRLISRYATSDGKIHDITQAVNFDYGYRERK